MPPQRVRPEVEKSTYLLFIFYNSPKLGAASPHAEDNVLRYIVKRKEGEGGARAAPPHTGLLYKTNRE